MAIYPTFAFPQRDFGDLIDVGNFQPDGERCIDLKSRNGTTVTLLGFDFASDWNPRYTQYKVYDLADTSTPLEHVPDIYTPDKLHVHRNVNLQSDTGLRLCVGPETHNIGYDNIAFAEGPPERILTVNLNRPAGDVTGAVNCSSGSCSKSLPEGSYTLTATADDGFDLDLAGCDAVRTIDLQTRECDVDLIGQDRTVDVTFTERKHILSVVLNRPAGDVTGAVTCSSGTCSKSLQDGQYTLTATADSGFDLSLAGCDAVRNIDQQTKECDVNMAGQDRTVHVNFTEKTLALTVVLNEPAGDVTGAVNCSSGACTENLPEGEYTLTGVADPGYFLIMSGCNAVQYIDQQTRKCDVNLVGSNRTVYAIFLKKS